MKRRVIRARLHSNLFLGGSAGELGDSLPPANKTLDGLSLTALGDHGVEGGLLVEFKVRGVSISALIPSANIKHLELAPEETKVK